MKRVLSRSGLQFLSLILLCAPALGQNSFFSFSAGTGSSTANKENGTAIRYHQLTFAKTGTVSACAVKVEQSADNSSWSDLIAAQTCTSSGQSVIVVGTVNYVRITFFTPVVGGGTVNAVYTGYNTAPSTNGFVFQGVLASIPATCTVGNLAFITDASAGGNIYVCSSTNTWTQVTGGGGGSPGGSNTQVQFNDSGSFGGNVGLTFTKASGNLTIGGQIASSTFGLPGVTHTYLFGNNNDVGNAAGISNQDINGNLLAPLSLPLAVNKGGTGTTTPALVAGTNVTITGTWPNQTVNATSSGGVTNSAGNNVVTKSNGTNLVASSIADDGTTVSLATTDLTVTSGNINANGGLLQSNTAFLIRATGGSGLTLNTTGGSGKFLLNPGGHIEQRYDSVQTLPTVHAGTCGTSPSITLGSSDNSLEIVVGTGGIASSCQVDFGQAFAKTDIVHAICTANSETDFLAIKVGYSTGASVIISATTPFTASSKISVNCW